MEQCSSEREIRCRRMLDTCSRVTGTSGDGQRSPQPYNRPLLLRLFCEHAQTADGSRDRFLDALCERVGLDFREDTRCEAVDIFADELVDGLFLPLKAVSSRYADGITTADKDADTTLSVCIFPPSPMTVDEDGELSLAGQTASQLLSMLDSTAVATLRQLHSADDKAASQQNTNAIALSPSDARAFYQYSVLDDELFESASDVRLFALHHSIARILHESGAGAHIDAILQDTGTEDLLTDGTTSHLGRLMQLRLDGWWDGRGQAGGRSWWIDASRFAQEEEDW
ncbi:hypothetical protein CMQ_440 [Grosmannia clavigera kw1407]|uniref:Uncharacterized protein n=1 Tax=Grosmannia clavigera (strain kw1407 / UAMH 11150) TaxID=655863 RepID=F0XEK6_GROCL|nr:uncharacterized protein CMQ_440 [Grosmannia clavigera kw1407]EFX03512.1 hypothetical protein CMQ_440 [Grosmannia clavigera kw1407]